MTSPPSGGLFSCARLLDSLSHACDTRFALFPLDISTVLLPFINEALRDFGPWAAVPAVLAVIGVEIRRKLDSKDREIAALREQVMELQEKRVHDAREMIRVAEAGTAATQARTQSDQRFIDVMETLLRRESGGLFGWRR